MSQCHSKFGRPNGIYMSYEGNEFSTKSADNNCYRGELERPQTRVRTTLIDVSPYDYIIIMVEERTERKTNE